MLAILTPSHNTWGFIQSICVHASAYQTMPVRLVQGSSREFRSNRPRFSSSQGHLIHSSTLSIQGLIPCAFELPTFPALGTCSAPKQGYEFIWGQDQGIRNQGAQQPVSCDPQTCRSDSGNTLFSGSFHTSLSVSCRMVRMVKHPAE